jgi:hypothetical protein
MNFLHLEYYKVRRILLALEDCVNTELAA